jgi:hypothetical protein
MEIWLIPAGRGSRKRPSKNGSVASQRFKLRLCGAANGGCGHFNYAANPADAMLGLNDMISVFTGPQSQQ